MNPGIGGPEIIVLVILALIIIGPKDLPLMMRKVGRVLGQARGMAKEFQRSFDEMGREAEMAELRREIDNLKNANPLNEVTAELRGAEADLRDPDGAKGKPAAKKPAPKPATGTLPAADAPARPAAKADPAPIRTGAPEDE